MAGCWYIICTNTMPALRQQFPACCLQPKCATTTIYLPHLHQTNQQLFVCVMTNSWHFRNSGSGLFARFLTICLSSFVILRPSRCQLQWLFCQVPKSGDVVQCKDQPTNVIHWVLHGFWPSVWAVLQFSGLVGVSFSGYFVRCQSQVM